MSQKKLYLLQLATAGAAEASTTSTKVMRRELANASFGGKLLDDVPDQLFRHRFTPDPSGAAHTAEEAAGANPCNCRPVVHKTMHPIRNGDGSNVTSFTAQVNDRPVPFALLKVPYSQLGEFVAAKSAGE